VVDEVVEEVDDAAKETDADDEDDDDDDDDEELDEQDEESDSSVLGGDDPDADVDDKIEKPKKPTKKQKKAEEDAANALAAVRSRELSVIADAGKERKSIGKKKKPAKKRKLKWPLAFGVIKIDDNYYICSICSKHLLVINNSNSKVHEHYELKHNQEKGALVSFQAQNAADQAFRDVIEQAKKKYEATMTTTSTQGHTPRGKITSHFPILPIPANTTKVKTNKFFS
jgi:hypothetical protein